MLFHRGLVRACDAGDVTRRLSAVRENLGIQTTSLLQLWSFGWVGLEREGGVVRVAAVDTEGPEAEVAVSYIMDE